jgi:hypothetical protein
MRSSAIGAIEFHAQRRPGDAGRPASWHYRAALLAIGCE